MIEELLRKYIERLDRASNCGCDYQCGCGVLDSRDVANTLRKMLPVKENMISAIEASKIAKDLATKINKDQITQIEKAVMSAANNCKFECYVDFTLNPIVKQYLVDKGYSVGANQGKYNETCVKISWEG
jgi:hypothetical protein